MSVEAACVLVEVTKSSRNWSPALRPEGMSAQSVGTDCTGGGSSSMIVRVCAFVLPIV